MNNDSRRDRIASAVMVAIVAIAPLLPTLRAAYVYDDTTIIRDNVLLRGWGALARVWTQPYWPVEGVDALGLYRPVHVALLAFVWNVTGGAPVWLHAYALVLSAASALAVWWMLRRGAGAGAALVATAWFAMHPLHVEAIASIANTSELLMVLCTIALVAVLVRMPATPDIPARDWKRAALIGALAAAALGAKESGLLSLPIAAVTAGGWAEPRSDGARAFLRRNMRAWMAAAVGIAIVIFARLVVLGAPVSHGSIAAQGIGAMSTGDRVAAMVSLWPRIAGMLVWPAALSPYYGPTIFPVNPAGVAVLSAVTMLALSGLALVVARRGERRPLVALAWIALTYLPASNLITPTGQILADRTLFGATVGVALAIAWMLDRLPSFGRRVAMAVIVLVAMRGAFTGATYAVAWTNHRALWTRLMETSPNEHLSYKLLGMDARARGENVRAVELLSRAFAMAPKDRQIRFELGQAQYSTHQYLASVKTFAPLLTDADARGEREFVALYLDASGRAGGPEAVVHAATPLLHSETAPTAALFLGVALEQLGRGAEADSVYALGLLRAPGDSALLSRRAHLDDRTKAKGKGQPS
ncbi:MAG: hypothetical protein ABIY52_12370 [Gemmatimonadaceae bacterium]